MFQIWQRGLGAIVSRMLLHMVVGTSVSREVAVCCDGVESSGEVEFRVYSAALCPELKPRLRIA